MKKLLAEYLKDLTLTSKGREMDYSHRYCCIVTALSKTIEIQQQIDEIYPEVEKNIIVF